MRTSKKIRKVPKSKDKTVEIPIVVESTPDTAESVPIETVTDGQPVVEEPNDDIVESLDKLNIQEADEKDLLYHPSKNITTSIPIAVIEIPDEEDRKIRAKTPEILEITEIEEKPLKEAKEEAPQVDTVTHP